MRIIPTVLLVLLLLFPSWSYAKASNTTPSDLVATVLTARSTSSRKSPHQWSTKKKIVVGATVAVVVAAAITVPIVLGVHAHQQHLHHLRRMANNRAVDQLTLRNLDSQIQADERTIEARLAQGHLTPQQTATLQQELAKLKAQDLQDIQILQASYGNPTGDPNNFFGPYFDNSIKTLYEEVTMVP